ncbi:YybH family protein [Streptomyces pseudovenezuelae]|uniref:YybH family protein n=1 Tax=Streptomyces pseudovenezuelae TaxID=67350 RepID=UPI002E80F529|nr:nuclear transport factor 2 family protein [Streptomyces pseudovenezuelae]WUA87004.1 nuclear transport factor 2 family protein [Streptomyces pseudovenezuelae]
MTVSTDDKAILNGVLDRWKAGVDAHRPERVAALFTEDAVFQGLHPYSVGRRGVAEYYDSQPPGMKASYRVLETRRPADGLVLGYLDVEFTFTDRPALAVKLAVLVTREGDDWHIAHYQVSRLEPGEA